MDDNAQHTGNHKQPGAPDLGGADRFGGTRAGAEHVEPSVTNIEQGPDVDRVAGLEKAPDEDARAATGPTRRTPERDERGRL